jgi:AbiU2
MIDMSGHCSKEELRQYIDRMMHEIINVKSKYQLWCRIQERRKDRLEAMNIAPSFFTLTFHSLFNDVIITLAKLYDRKAQAGSIHKFLNIASQNIQFFDYKDDPSDKLLVTQEKIEEYRAGIEDKNKIINHLFTWRDKVFAHNDKKYFFDRNQLLVDAELTTQNINDLIEYVRETINTFSIALDGKAWYPESSNVMDVDKVLDILHDYQKNVIDKISFTTR